MKPLPLTTVPFSKEFVVVLSTIRAFTSSNMGGPENFFKKLQNEGDGTF